MKQGFHVIRNSIILLSRQKGMAWLWAFIFANIHAYVGSHSCAAEAAQWLTVV